MGFCQQVGKNCPSAWTLQIMMGVGQGRIYQVHSTKDTHKRRANLPWLRSPHGFCKCFEPKGHSRNWRKPNLVIKMKSQINCTPVFTVNISKTRAIRDAHTKEVGYTERVGMHFAPCDANATSPKHVYSIAYA